MDYLLPATVYQSPPRLGRGRPLNTILEDYEESTSGPASSDSEATVSDVTVVAIKTQSHQTTSQTNTRGRLIYPSSPASVVSSLGTDEEGDCEPSSRSSYAGSETGTVFSESCPSLTGSNASGATTFVTNSNRTSIASRSSRNRYPSLLIPQGSWDSDDGQVKQITFGMSPSTKILLSPEVLKSLPQIIPSLDVPPSLGDGSSIGSQSPYLYDCSSLPATPDMHNLEINDGQPWGGNMVLETPLEITIDDHHSILLSPADAHSSNRMSLAASSDWGRLMGNFPRVPGATPQEQTPITPDIPHGLCLSVSAPDTGVQLPAQALEILRSLTRVPSPSLASEANASMQEEMQEVKAGISKSHTRPRSFELRTPMSDRSFSNLSDYSYSDLSIPSPGGFFSSLKPGTRRTWSSSRGRSKSPPPSSTTAENFYNTPWTKPKQDKVVETVLEVSEGTNTDGPPTVRQSMFNSGIKTPKPKESEDLYGGATAEQDGTPARPSSGSSILEHDQAYEDGIKQAAEVNFDRTSHWLTAQTTYLAALRETNPLNDPADFLATSNLAFQEEDQNLESISLATEQAVRFLEEANRSSPGIGCVRDSPVTSPREALFLEAYNFVRGQAKRPDTFVQASTRLESIQTTRVALPKLHLQTLLNNHDSGSLDSGYLRPKYRGPFGQNPRHTGAFTKTQEHEQFATLEKQQKALATILPSIWTTQAQRHVLYNGRLLACNAAYENLSKKAAKRDSKKGLRILDLGGAATASWAWAAASKWRNAQVFTVQSKQQVDLKTSSPVREKVDGLSSPVKPANPINHRVLTVPHFWQLPFKSDHFDVISARTLYMYLRASPVPDVDSIDEWDLTLKECMRVLKPGGVLDFFTMDSGISNSSFANSAAGAVNLSPNAMADAPSTFSSTAAERSSKARRSADAIAAEFTSQLRQRGYEQDGGCGQLMSRLRKEGFTGLKRQWVGLPMGYPADGVLKRNVHSRTASADSYSAESTSSVLASTTSSNANKNDREMSYASHFNPDGTSRGRSYRLAPRPISEVSSVSKIVDQYLNVEAVQGPVGSTADVSAVSALFGESLWEEWLVRLRLEGGKAPENVLDGVHEALEEFRRSGNASWKCLVGWARKPTKKELAVVAMKNQRQPSFPVERVISVGSAIGIEHEEQVVTPLVLDTRMSQTRAVYEQYYGEQRSYALGTLQRGMSHASMKTLGVTQSAVERGEAGDIPMMMFG